VCLSLDELFDRGEFDPDRGSSSADLEASRQAVDRYLDRIGAILGGLEKQLREREAAQLVRIVEGQEAGR
jgi:hypothetical protein